MAAAKRFFDKVMGANGDPGKVAMDKSAANKAAIDAINAGRDVLILVRQVKYLNNIAEQDHRAIKGDQADAQLQIVPVYQLRAGRIELMHAIRKGQFAVDDAAPISFADQFYALAGEVRPV